MIRPIVLVIAVCGSMAVGTLFGHHSGKNRSRAVPAEIAAFDKLTREQQLASIRQRSPKVADYIDDVDQFAALGQAYIKEAQKVSQ